MHVSYRSDQAVFPSAAFCCGTVLTLSASEDGISETPSQDTARRSQAKADLRLVIEALKEAGQTWTTAQTSAHILEGPLALIIARGAPGLTHPHSLPPDMPSTSSDLDLSLTTPALLDQWEPTVAPPADFSWKPQTFDTETFSASFPYIFPSFDLDPTGQLDFMSLLNEHE